MLECTSSTPHAVMPSVLRAKYCCTPHEVLEYSVGSTGLTYGNSTSPLNCFLHEAELLLPPIVCHQPHRWMLRALPHKVPATSVSNTFPSPYHDIHVDGLLCPRMLGTFSRSLTLVRFFSTYYLELSFIIPTFASFFDRNCDSSRRVFKSFYAWMCRLICSI